MSGAAAGPSATSDLTEKFIRFYRTYYRDELGELAQLYPKDERALNISYDDLAKHNRALANDWLKQPEQIQEYADTALHTVDLPADINLCQDEKYLPSEVRLVNLPDDATYYPGGYSPTDIPGEYVALRGEVAMATDVFARLTEAAFECQRCGTMTRIPQSDGKFQEPHECQGCERQGPFRINHDQSEFIDAQVLRLQEPPNVAGGEGATVDVYLEADLTGRVETGDELVVYGTVHLRQMNDGQQKDAKFETYLDARAVEFEESSAEELDISSEERKRIRELAAGEEGDPLELAAKSLSAKIYGYEHVKKAAILQIVGGETVQYPDGSTDRGDFHMLLIGDPSTGKSRIVDAVERIAPRAAAISASGAGKAGITASAVRDDFGEGEWSLKPGAFAKANGGIVCVEELDDLDAEKRASMLEPMSKQTIAISKAGINTKLQTRVGVIAAANPKHGRFDPYEDTTDQFVFGSAMLSRFDLIFTFKDEPDPEDDADIASHISGGRRAGKKWMRDDREPDEDDKIDTPIDPNFLRKWIALASRSDPPIEDEEALADARDRFVALRGSNGYEPEDPVPVTWRSWEAVLRIAEAAAKFEFSDTVEERHFEIATQLAGKSMQDIGKNEDDQLDADVVETGTSKPQAQRKKTLEKLIRGLSGEDDVVEYDTLYQEANEHDISDDAVDEEIREFKDKGWAIEPNPGTTVKWLGRA